LPYCPAHRLRVHARTFVYYNGADKTSQRNAALRNIRFEREYFERHVLGNAAKAETHRICHETSEDAVSWNVFSRLARAGLLGSLLSTCNRSSVASEPELCMWGLGIRLSDPAAPPAFFPALKSARDRFERGIERFLTEPDIMLYVPGQVLVLIEAKFTQGNTVARSAEAHDADGEKPKSREGILRRYAPSALPPGSLLDPPLSKPFYSQLYRNLVFAIYMANELKVRWRFVNLVSERQFSKYEDPTPFIHAVLPEKSRPQFLFYSWERLYADHVARVEELKDLGEYMRNKSAHEEKALAIEDD
jgi:hypothetical protein